MQYIKTKIFELCQGDNTLSASDSIMMKHRILAYCDHQNSVTCMMGCIFTIIILYSIAFHVCKRAQRYPMVDFLTGHRLGTDISSEHI